MKAQIIERFGDPTVFQLKEIPKPSLLPGHVLIQVKATSVNPIDTRIRQGLVTQLAPEFPAVLHGDVAGIIAEVAKDVKNFKPGDEVYGLAGGFKGTGGALAEFMLADAKLLAKKPKSISMTEAAALPLVTITAWEGLFDKIKLQKNHKILIHGGTGGVGHIAVQLAKWRGATVYTTVGNINDANIVKALGADHVINYKEEPVADYIANYTDGNGFECIFDTVGGTNLINSFTAAAPNAVIATTNARVQCDLQLLHQKGLGLFGIFMLMPLISNKNREHYAHILTEISQIIDQGKLKPLIDPHLFSLDQITAAHVLLESGEAKGKVVITIA